MKYAFNISGGVGRIICATGAIKLFCENHPDDEVLIVTNHTDAFFNLGVENLKTIGIDTPRIYRDYLFDAEYSEPEPYNELLYNIGKVHLCQSFNRLINGRDEFIDPIINLTESEKEKASSFAKQFKKPIILFQPFGNNGGMSENGIPMTDPTHRSLKKEFANEIFKQLKDDYDVVVVKMPNQAGIEGALNLGQNTSNGSTILPLRAVTALIPFIHSFIGVDSFLQHACHTQEKKGVVFWTTTRIENCGYESNLNIKSDKKSIYLPNRIPNNEEHVELLNDGVESFSYKTINEIKKFLSEVKDA